MFGIFLMFGKLDRFCSRLKMLVVVLDLFIVYCVFVGIDFMLFFILVVRLRCIIFFGLKKMCRWFGLMLCSVCVKCLVDMLVLLDWFLLKVVCFKCVVIWVWIWLMVCGLLVSLECRFCRLFVVVFSM